MEGPERMKKHREKQQERASNEGRKPRSSKEYTEDLRRGPSCTRSIINHAYKTIKQVKEIKDEIGFDKYKEVFEKTDKMLSSLELQGTFALYNDRLQDVINSRSNEQQPNARELESGVDITDAVEGLITFSKMYMKDNLMLLRQECIHRGIMDAATLGWMDMRRAIQQQEIDNWRI